MISALPGPDQRKVGMIGGQVHLAKVLCILCPPSSSKLLSDCAMYTLEEAKFALMKIVM